jgi:hypothetical protein
MWRIVGLAVAVGVASWQAQPAPAVDVTGAWSVTLTMAGRQVTGLAILSQDGETITGMIGPGETEMMPADGTVSGNTVVLMTRPRKGRTAAFAKCEMTVKGDRMTGTLDTDKGTIELVKRKRPESPGGGGA